MLGWVSARAQTSEISAQRYKLSRKKKILLFCASSHVICHLTIQEMGHRWELLVVPERCFIKVQMLILQQTGETCF